MAPPVWALSVDLQTKTATFQSGLGDAARSARGAFQDIKSGAGEMGGAVGRSSGEARHAVMMLGEEFGIHLPRGVTSFIASLGPVAAVMEQAFPFIAIAAGALVLLEHLKKVREEAEKSAQEEARFGTTIQQVFNALDEKILEAEKRSDELKDNHLGALRDELKLIDMQSLDDLSGQFEKLAGAADKTLQTLKSDWFEFGSGSTGAAHALSDFQTQYQSLLAQGKGEEASNLLSGTLYTARVLLADMKTLRTDADALNSGRAQSSFSPVERQNAAQALNALKAAGVGWTDKELQAQQTLVQLLLGQVGVEQRINQLKSVDKGNAIQQTNKDITADATRQADAEREGRDQYIRELSDTGKEARETYEKSIQDMIDATKEGSAERLEAIRQGMHEEEQAGLEGTEFYQHLATEQLQVQRQMADDAKKTWLEMQQDQERVREQMAQEEARHQAQMLQIRQQGQSGGLAEIGRLATEREQADLEYQFKKQALEQQLELYRQGGEDQVKQAQQTAMQLDLLDQQHADKVAELQQQQSQAIRGSLTQVATDYATTFMSIAEGHQHLTQTMIRLADQGIDRLIAGSLQLMMHNKSEQLSSAKTAAASAYKAMAGIPFIGPELGAVAAAGVFAGAMAFNRGTDMVPGVTKGDSVPALLTPGEGVVPGGVMDNLRTMARHGGFDQQKQIHIHGVSFAPQIHALDSNGVEDVLTAHQDTFQRHFEGVLRRMNK